MPADDAETIWSARRTTLSVLTGLPTIVVSAAFAGIVLLGVFEIALPLLVAAAIVIVVARVVVWTAYVARREVVVTQTHLRVVRAGRTLVEMPWAETAAVELKRGDSLARIILDVTSTSADFPYIVATPTDVWDTRGLFPGLLAFLPTEFRRLAAALEQACGARSVPFSIEAR